RFWPKVDKQEDGCWLWAATKNQDGYGRFWHNGRLCSAHRVAYEMLVGPIPEGTELDHLCRVRACVNPVHLEAVTHKENVFRSPINPTTIWAARDHCHRGHEYTPENTYRNPKKPNTRCCRQCQ